MDAGTFLVETSKVCVYETSFDGSVIESIPRADVDESTINGIVYEGMAATMMSFWNADALISCNEGLDPL